MAVRRIPILFGRFLVKSGAATEAQVRKAAQLQKEILPSIGEVALLLGSLATEQVRDIRLHQRDTGASFLEAGEALGILDEDEYDRLEGYLERQKLPIGEALVLHGVFDADRLEALLEEHRAARAPDEEDAAA